MHAGTAIAPDNSELALLFTWIAMAARRRAPARWVTIQANAPAGVNRAPTGPLTPHHL